MTLAKTPTGNAVARRFDAENFQTYAHQELQAAPYWEHGVCFNPGCGAVFTPRRDWQIYCCTACERKGMAEMRTFGHRMALPLLLHRIGKYETEDAGVQDRTRAARRYVTQVQSAWLSDRQARAQERQG